MRIIPTTVLAVVLALATAASADNNPGLPVKGLENARWGMSPAQVRAAFPGAKKKNWNSAAILVVGRLSVEGAPTYVELHFDKRGLSAVFVANNDWERISRALDSRLAAKRANVWTDGTTDVWLTGVAGCHSTSYHLWLRPAG